MEVSGVTRDELEQESNMRIGSVIASVAAAVLPTIVVTAGSFTSDFSDPWQLGYTLNGTAYVEEGHCALT